MLEGMNFSSRWRKWISGCLSSASSNVIVNGSPSGEFHLGRGLRQGDPLSPFLFLVAAEGLHLLTERASQKGLLEPFPVGDPEVHISHLQYADDTMLVTPNKRENAWACKCILKLFEILSGLSVNFHKSCMVGIGIDAPTCRELADTMYCQVGSLPTKYLGVNIGARLRGIADWNYLTTKIKKKISVWENRKISLGGRLTLVRSLLSSIPIYHMSFSLIPKAVIAKINSVMCNFLWGGGGNVRKIAWVKWVDICRPFKYGGLGVKNLEWFNRALVGKWMWRFLTNREALWAKVVRARHGDLYWDEEGFKLKGQRVAQAGWWGRVVGLSQGEGGKGFRQNLALSLGNGQSVLFWHHVWSGEGSLKSTFPRLFRLSSNQEGSVMSMGRWVEDTWVWDLGWSRELLDREKDQNLRLLTMLSNVSVKAGTVDSWRWKASPNGIFSTKTAYEVFRVAEQGENEQDAENSMAELWKMPVPFKVITTVWRIMKGRMATSDNLARRNITLSCDEAKCVACQREPESADHFFLFCEETSGMWKDILRWLGLHSAMSHHAKEHLLQFSNLGTKSDRKFLVGLWCAVVWCLWKWRNDIKFNNLLWDRDKIMADIKSRFWDWKTTYGIQVSPLDFKSWFIAADLSSRME